MEDIYEESQMRKRKSVFGLLNCTLILLVGFSMGMLMAADQPEKEAEEIAMAETAANTDAEASASNNPSPATLASELNEMRELIDSQRRQIEKLQSTVEQQQKDLNKAMSTIAPSSETATQSKGTAGSTLQASNAPASGSASTAAAPQSGSAASKLQTDRHFLYFLPGRKEIFRNSRQHHRLQPIPAEARIFRRRDESYVQPDKPLRQRYHHGFDGGR
jgi:TolA-binding protein